MNSTWTKTHLSCPDCGSSDALAINSDGWSTCFSCNKRTPPDKDNGMTYTPTPAPVVSLTSSMRDKLAVEQYSAIPARKISKQTCEKYHCLVDGSDIIFGYSKPDGALTATKTRRPNKDFIINGDWRSAGLYGQNLFQGGGKYITITEGELDALAAYQMMGSKWAVVSIKNGAQSALKSCKEQYEWLMTFERIVLCFDNDEAGQKATAEVAELFGSKCSIMRLRKGYKDACEYLINGDVSEFIDTFWRAEKYVPDGIINAASLLDEVLKPLAKADCMYPFAELNKLTYGIRFGEMVTLTAGSGLGKSQVLREIIYHIYKNTTDNIGCLFLEEGVRKTALSLMSLEADKPLHLPDTEVTDDEKREAFEHTLGSGRFYLFDHFGSTSVENIINRVRYMAKALECRFIVLDHVSIVVSAQASGDERKALDEIMTKLRMMTQETNIALLIVSHLKRPDGKGHEEGSATSLSQLRGSGSIAQLSDMVIGLERNGQHEDPIERNTTFVRVLKNRFAGVTGPAGRLFYSLETGRMTERFDEEEL